MGGIAPNIKARIVLMNTHEFETIVNFLTNFLYSEFDKTSQNNHLNFTDAVLSIKFQQPIN